MKSAKEMFIEAKKRSTSLIVPPPLIWTIEPTTNCMLNCKYCIHGNLQLHKHLQSINWQIDKQLIYNLEYELSNFAERITLCGSGETFLNKDVFEILQFIRRINNHCNILVNTNLQIELNEDQLMILSEARCMLVISLDNIDYKLNEKTRPNSNSFKIINRIKKIIKFKEKHNVEYPRIGISTIITKNIVNNLKEHVKYFYDIGCIVSLLHLIPVYIDSEFKDYISEDEKIIINEHITDLFKLYKNTEFTPKGTYLYHSYDLLKEESFVQDIRNGMCLDPWFTTILTANGETRSCIIYGVTFDETAEYLKMNISQYNEMQEYLKEGYKPFMKIWNGSAMINFRDNIKTNNLPKGCEKCYKINQRNIWYSCTYL